MSRQPSTTPTAQHDSQRRFSLPLLLVMIGLEVVAVMICVVIILSSTTLSQRTLEGDTSLLMTVAPALALASFLVSVLGVLLVRAQPTSRVLIALHAALPAAITPAVGFSGGTLDLVQLGILAVLSGAAAIAGAVGAAALRARRNR